MSTLRKKVLLTQKKHININYVNPIHQKYNSNRNAELYLQPSNKVYKEYLQYDDKTLKNHYVLLYLSSHPSIINSTEYVTPEEIICENKRICGYIMPYYEKTESLSKFIKSDKVTEQLKLDCFVKLAKSIATLPKDVFIGDLHGENVLVLPSGEIRFIDIDGFSVKNCEMTCPLFSQPIRYDVFCSEKYFHKDNTPRISRETDIFCFFVLFLEWVMGVDCLLSYSKLEIFEYFRFLESTDFNKDIIKMIYRLFDIEKNFIDANQISELNLYNFEKYKYSVFCDNKL